MYVLHLSVDCQGFFFVRHVWRFKYMIDVQREYIYESQDCTTRYQYNRDRPALDDVVPILILISIVTHVCTKRRTVPVL
jgi:hypothetical protein